MKSGTPQMDWQQVVLNGGPPCFHVEGPQYCGRAEHWPGHGNAAFHDYVSLDDLLNTERERCAKIADERAAFNRRLATGSKISDTIDSRVADLKFTRADEAEVIAKEIREGKQSEDYATVRANSAVDAIRGKQ